MAIVKKISHSDFIDCLWEWQERVSPHISLADDKLSLPTYRQQSSSECGWSTATWQGYLHD